MGGARPIELVRTKPVLWEERCTGVSPRSTVRRMRMGFPATLITIPSVYVVPYATPLGGRLVRNMLVLGRCSPRRRATSMMVILLGLGVHTLQSYTLFFMLLRMR
jgi:hypothetical protein